MPIPEDTVRDGRLRAAREAVGPTPDKRMWSPAVLSAAIVLMAGLLLVVAGLRCAGVDEELPPVRPISNDSTGSAWATPIERPGLPNFHKVSDTLYRGAQPTAEGMRELQRMGVRTVVNLRAFHSDRDEIGSTGLAREHIRMNAWRPEDEDVTRFLRIVTDPRRTPVFVHCYQGADRTGTLCAIYRIAVQGWTKDEAIREMTEGGFGFHEEWVTLTAFIRELDVEAVRRAARISPGPGPDPAGRK